jgi:tetratricopeptide (TPR) repeat protein
VIVFPAVWTLLAALDGQPSKEGATAPASAEASASGEDLFRRGVAAYDAHEYAAAIEWFRKAYAKDAEPAILFNIAQAYKALDDCPRALETMDAFLKASRPNDPLVARARAKRAELERCAPPAQDVKPPVTPLETSKDQRLPPAPVPTLQAAPLVAAPERSRFFGTRLATTCTLSAGTTVALGLTDLALIIAANTFASRVNEATAWTREIQTAEDKRDAFATAATITGVAAGVSAAVAATTCWLHWRRNEQPSSPAAP